jgi:hypothetical protein
MFSIGEFARLGSVSVRTLRHYDEIGLLPPATVDPVEWIVGHGYQVAARAGRDVWVHEVDDIADAAQQVFEIQLAFTCVQ